MSDADRALANLKARLAARAAAVPHAVTDEDSLPIITDGTEDTPVEVHGRRRRKRQSVQQFAEDIKTEVRELRRAIDEAIRAELNKRGELAERLVKVETAVEFIKELDDDTAAAELLRLRADLTSLRVTLVGEKGDNGKIGALTEKADRGPRFMKRAIALALGSLLGSIIPAAIYVKGIVEASAAERAAVRAELRAAEVDRAGLHASELLLFRLVGAHGRRGADSNTPTGDPSQ